MHPTVAEARHLVDEVLTIRQRLAIEVETPYVSFFIASQNSFCPSATLAVQCSAAKSLASSVMNFNARQRTEWRWQTWAIANSSMSTMSILFSLSHGSLDVTKLSPVPQVTSPYPDESLSRAGQSGVHPRGASGIAIMSRCTT